MFTCVSPGIGWLAEVLARQLQGSSLADALASVPGIVIPEGWWHKIVESGQLGKVAPPWRMDYEQLGSMENGCDLLR